MGLNPLIIFKHLLNDWFSSPFKRFKSYQGHIFVFVLFIVGISRYPPRSGRKASVFNRVFNWAMSKFAACFCAFWHNIPVVCWSWSVHILWAIMGWKTGVNFLWSLKLHGPAPEWRHNDQYHRARNIIAWQRKQSWPLPPANYNDFLLVLSIICI